jgi:hypothetical protein
MTIAEYARHRGCDEKAVRKALQEQRITRISTEKRCIDPEVADIQWAKNTRARGDSGGKTPGAGPKAPGEAEGSARDDFTAVRTRRELAEAQMAEIELAKASGKVLDRESTLRAVYTKFRELRDDAAGIGRRAAPLLAPLSDAREIRVLIDREVSAAFHAFAKRQLQAMADQITGAPTVLPADLLSPPAQPEGDAQ